MKPANTLRLLLLCLLLLAQAFTLQIYYVSSSPNSIVSPVKASLRGGTMIYMKVTGHSPDAADNVIYVGIYPCVVPSDGVSDTFIACQTTDTGSSSDISSLPVTIISGGTSYTTSYPNTVYFQDYYTPNLIEVYPSSGFAYSTINFYGVHRITDLGDGLRAMGDVTKLLLGKDLCSRFDVEQAAISRNGYNYIQCTQSHLQEAGKYNVSEQLTPGFAKHYLFLRKSSLVSAEYFEFAALPTVTAVTPAHGNLGGQKISITGTGFSLNKLNNSVLVDGNPCSVTYSDEGTIKCTIAPKNNSLSTRLSTTSGSQANGYFSGAGLKYARYSYSSSLSSFVSAVRSNNASALGTPAETGFRAELREGNYYGAYYGQTWSGYFTAPVSGTYTFIGNADDVFSFYLATVTGSTELPATPLIYSSGFQYWDDFYINYYPTAQADVVLEGGKSYYLQAYHLNGAGTGAFRIDVQVPNNNTSLSFQTYQIDEVFLNSTIQPEVLVYTMSGATNGTFNLRIYRTDASTGKVTYDVDVDVTYGCSAATFAAALNSFDIYQPYQISVTRTIYDSSNNVINTVAGAASITYNVNVLLFRPSSITSQSFIYTKNTYNGVFTQPSAAAQSHSPVVSGTFTLSIGGVTIDPYGNGTLYYDSPASDIQSFIQAHITDFPNVEVSKGYQYSCQYSCSWYIKYKSYNGHVANVVANGAGLSGGVGSPSVVVNTRRDFSTNILFSPIDYRFLSVPASSPNVIVSTNGVPSICTGTCAYDFQLYSEVTSLSRSGSVLSFAISDPQSLGFTSSQLHVTVQGQPCVVDTSTAISALTCQLPTNGDGSVALVASGSITPQVWVGNYGLAALATGVTPFSIPLVVNAPAITSGGTNGGYVLTITGNGFPTDTSKISITLCSSKATIKTSTSTQVSFYAPSCSSTGTQTLNVQVGSVTNTDQTFDYTAPSSAPTIMSLSPTSANPGIKGVLEINGNNFGSDTSLIQVFLSNSSGKVYTLNVLSGNNTYLKVGLSGGLAGTFTVQVNLQSSGGDSVPASVGADQFQYVVSVSSVSPAQGSINGGSLITITGQNFATGDSQTLVFIGDAMNWMCTIESITATSIQCRTPAISNEYSPGVAQTVLVTTRLIIESACSGTCTFTYLSSSSSPALSSLTVSGSTVSLVGTSFTAGSSCSASLTNTVTSDVTVVPATTCSATAATFPILSSIISGTYNVKVRSELGESDSKQLTVNWSPGTQSPTSGSTAGTLVTFSGGSNYPVDLTNSQFSVFIKDSAGKQTAANVVSCCSNNSITVLMPAAADGSTFSINFAGPANTAKGNFVVYAANTGALSLTSASTVAPGATSITLTITKSISNPIVAISLVSTRDSTYVISVSNWTTSGSTITFSAVLTSGDFSFQVRGANKYYSISDTIHVSAPTNIVTTPQSYSYNGGTFTVQASGLSPISNIRVNSLKGKLLSYNQNTNTFTYQLPALLTTLTQSTYSLAKTAIIDLSSATFFSDTTNNSNVSSTFDGSSTTFYGSSNSVCWIGVDFGAGLGATIDRIRLFPDLYWVNTASIILGAQFQGSNDLSTWTTLATVDQTIHSGWNTLVSSSSSAFRYVRFLHNSTSQCNIAEIQLFGVVLSNTVISNLASFPSDIIYEDGSNTVTFAGNATYTSARTAIVTSFSPKYGDIFGGYTLTIYGTNLNFDTPSVVIDGVTCANAVAVNSTAITCTVGARLSLPASNSLTIKIGASTAILRDTFYYVLRWSDSRTWGVDLPPIDGDLVSVPQGMTLLVDQDTPVVKGIAVTNGTLIFSDQNDLTVSAGFITVVGGKLIAGTEQSPFQKKLTFIMYGDYYGKQQPMFGNKGIGCMECSLSIYGIPRTPTWTTIAASISPNDNTFTVSEDVDWQVGEEIVVASTSFYHWEAERRTITAVSGRTITVNASFVYPHVATVENYGSSDKLPMIAEVGLLTRNIKMRGDDSSHIRQYGSHLMIAGQAANGAEGHIAYTEFTQCGQPAILGRYCIHFHMNGDVPTSFVRGNAVHDSFARVVTVHAVYYLTVEYNVGYRVKGHNFFVEDGIETHNTLRYNLAIGSLTSSNMLQTDTSVASFWITNPSNNFYGNHAAGSDFYGIWYEIKPNPDGPSATSDVCPVGNPLGSVHDNVAHSNVRFGLRIFQLFSRQYPCQPVRDNKNGTDPWYSNPSQTSLFQNFVLYKNLEDGLLAEQTGNVVFKNFTIGENYHSGVEFYLANFTREPPLVINSAIIGQSRTNAASNTTNYTLGMSGAITGRSGTTNLSDIRFYNYPQGSVLFQTCRLCDDPLKYTNLGTEVILSKIKLTNVTGGLLNMIGLKRDVIYDLDGSLSNAFDGTSRASATIVYGYPHIASTNPIACPTAPNSDNWDGAVMCDSTVTIRRVVFTNLDDHQKFAAQHMQAIELTNITNSVPDVLSSTLYTSIVPTLPNNPMESKDKSYSYALPYITGRIYNIWWGSGIDFLHLSAFTSPSFVSADKGIIFKFNYSENRELYRIGPVVGGVALVKANYLNESASYLDPNTCKNGDYYHNNDDNSSVRMFTLCQSGKDRALYEYTDVTGVVCQLVCPLPPGTYVLQDFVRLWSNATQWPGGVVPQAGDNVTVKGEWRLLLDVDPNPINNLTIDGNLIADDTRDVNITANFIWIRAGNFSAGSKANPFTHKLTIQLNGQKTDTARVIDPILTGNKLFVVTGTLNLYASPPSSVIATLTQTAFSGSSTIYVDDSTDWVAGDTLVLAPSFSTYSEFESVTIQSVNNDSSITLTSALQYTHYGASSTTVKSVYGNLDARAKVGHINRNIKITAGPDSGWGFSLYVYGYTDTASVRRVGNAKLIGVQFENGGQLDTTNSPLVFKNVVNGNYSSVVESSSFINCRSFCINVDTSNNITIDTNVLYNAWVFGVQIKSMKSFTFTNNAIIGVSARPTVGANMELIACFSSLFYVDPINDDVQVTDNFCQGSVGHGWALAHIGCDELQINPFANNTAGSADIGFIFNKIDQDCQGFSYIKAYACSIGQINGPPTSKSISFSNFILADNGRGATLKQGASEGSNNHTAYFKNSYITPVSRPGCSYCYGNGGISCVNNIGVRMFTASANGEIMPGKFGHGFDVICKQPVFDSKAFLTNIIFDNFKQSYTDTNVSSACSANFVFRPHTGAFDMVGGHYLNNCNCTNCDNNSYALCDAPNPNMLGWFGGCGDIICTGKHNYIITDWTGGFFGSPATLIGNNSVIGDNEPNCVFSSSMNGYLCQRTDFATLEYQSIAADFNKRIMWPVNLTYDGANYTTITNGWREWEWLGKEPQNQRFGRFVSVVRLNQTYNMTFAAIPPHSLQLQIQSRNLAGNSSNYVIIRLYYALPNSIRVTVNNQVKKPLLLTDNVNALTTLDVTSCGNNFYFYTNSTIEFVLTEDPACVAVISLVDSITLTTHFSMDINTFFSSSSYLTNFINNLMALLQISDTSRVKVVGVYSGSVIVSAVIEAATTTTNNSVSNSTPTSNSSDLASLAATLSNHINDGTFAATMNGGSSPVGPVQTVSATANYLSTPSDSNDPSNIALIVGVAAGGAVLVILVVIGMMWIVRKRAKVVEGVVSEESFPQENEQKNADIFSKGSIHPEHSNIMLRNMQKSAFEVKDVDE